jgi:hypothetical protein
VCRHELLRVPSRARAGPRTQAGPSLEGARERNSRCARESGRLRLAFLRSRWFSTATLTGGEVVDPSVLVAALVDTGPNGSWAEAVLARGSLHAPELARVEATNILRRLELAKQLTTPGGSLQAQRRAKTFAAGGRLCAAGTDPRGLPRRPRQPPRHHRPPTSGPTHSRPKLADREAWVLLTLMRRPGR